MNERYHRFGGYTTDGQCLALLRSKVDPLKVTKTIFRRAFFEVRDLKRMWPGSGLADKNRRDYGIEGKFWSGWRD